MELGAIGVLVAGVAVVASLFVGFQLRQNSLQAREGEAEAG